MAKHWRILGLPLLALVGVLAVNASAAQADWVILESTEGHEVSSISLKGSGEGGFLLSETGSKIHCEAAAGSGTASLSETNKKLSGVFTITFTGCTDQGFKGTCTVHSEGQAAGTIVASGNAVAGMAGEVVYAKASSEEFTTIDYEGNKCPLNEFEEPISGSVKITVESPLTLATSHGIVLEGEELKLGASNATLHMLEGSTPLPQLHGTIEQSEGHPFSVHLINL